MSIFISIMIILCFILGAPISLIIELVCIVVGMACIATHKPCQQARDLRKRLKKVPKDLKRKARTSYPRDWRAVAIECNEAHICGDCQLCGAE